MKYGVDNEQEARVRMVTVRLVTKTGYSINSTNLGDNGNIMALYRCPLPTPGICLL